MKTVSINLYTFDELNEAAQEKAIIEHVNFLVEVADFDERDEISREYVIENIQINDYLFFADGELAHCTTYTDSHPKSGTTEFHFHGATFDITA